MWIKEPRNGSVTTTMFVVGFIVCTLKLLVSGMSFGAFTMEKFSGGDYATANAALGAIYVMRRYNRKDPSESSNPTNG